ncbi:MAG: hypothetical protein ABI883_05490, partial [Chthoniobacterales bacterium]
MKVAEAIDWFKNTYGDRIAAAVEDTPFNVDLICAVAYQETGYIWSGLVAKGLPPADILRLCVGDTLDADRGRSCFPKNKADLLSAPRGREMFAIARQALLDMAQHTRGYESATINPNKFCRGYGIFQYDLQFFEEDPTYFLEKRWGDFDACLEQFLGELRAAAGRQRWKDRRTFTDDEQVYLAIAYNKGTADCRKGFQQGHKSDDGRCYGENVYDFLRLAQSIVPRALRGKTRAPQPSPDALPAAAIAGKGTPYEVRVTKLPLRLRSEPRVPARNPRANVVALLRNGQLVFQLSPPTPGSEFVEIETELDGKKVRGFAASAFLQRVERAIAVKEA